MFDIGMSELLVIGIVALIVVGPKDLPGLFHTLGRFTAKARTLGREFTNAMNQAARESGMDDVANTLKGVSNPKKMGLDKLSEAADRFDRWDPSASKGDASGEKGKPTEQAKPLDPDRQADIEKIRAATEKAGREKLEREAAAKAAADAPEAPAAPKTDAPKTNKADTE